MQSGTMVSLGCVGGRAMLGVGGGPGALIGVGDGALLGETLLGGTLSGSIALGVAILLSNGFTDVGAVVGTVHRSFLSRAYGA